ncbi:hypothetical protein V1478_002530, partial [Vespula squamosa]
CPPCPTTTTTTISQHHHRRLPSTRANVSSPVLRELPILRPKSRVPRNIGPQLPIGLGPTIVLPIIDASIFTPATISRVSHADESGKLQLSSTSTPEYQAKRLSSFLYGSHK